jgi:dienelactone hydrolase
MLLAGFFPVNAAEIEREICPEGGVKLKRQFTFGEMAWFLLCERESRRGGPRESEATGMPLPKTTLYAAFAAAAIVIVFIGTARAQRAASLERYKIRPNKIFVAGISSGGAMAVQMSVAYSRLFKGAAIYAGIPYQCAQDSEATALTTCEEDEPAIDLAALETITRNYAKQHLIDPLSFLRQQRVYLWSGIIDVTVRQPVMDLLDTYYQDFHAHVFQYDNTFNAAHGWESPYGPNPCDVEDSPFIVLCHDSDRIGGSGSQVYDSEQVWLSEFFGKLSPKNDGTLAGAVVPFDQNEFSSDGAAADIGMDATGYAFVPADCAASKRCGLVLALHGCNQYHGEIGSQFIDDSGINQWADTNHIVVVYPQTIEMASNPAGCWDWWGYLNHPDYAQKSGPQMQALYRMVNRASGRID